MILSNWMTCFLYQAKDPVEAWADLESVVRTGVVKARGGTEEQIEVIWAFSLLARSISSIMVFAGRCGRAPQLRRLEKE